MEISGVEMKNRPEISGEINGWKYTFQRKYWWELFRPGWKLHETVFGKVWAKFEKLEPQDKEYITNEATRGAVKKALAESRIEKKE